MESCKLCLRPIIKDGDIYNFEVLVLRHLDLKPPMHIFFIVMASDG